MLPDIETDNGGATDAGNSFTHEGTVLIGSGADREGLVGFDVEPSPSRAEAADAGCGEFFFHRIEGAEGGIDGGGELGRRGRASGAEDGPEEGVIGVSARVVAEGATNTFRHFAEIGDEFINAQSGEVIVTFERGVGFADVSLVMLVVMNFHRAGIDVGLECVCGVRKVWECVCHNRINYFRLKGGGKVLLLGGIVNCRLEIRRADLGA